MVKRDIDRVLEMTYFKLVRLPDIDDRCAIFECYRNVITGGKRFPFADEAQKEGDSGAVSLRVFSAAQRSCISSPMDAQPGAT